MSRGKLRKKEILNILLIGTIIAFIFIFYLWHHLEGIKLGYKIEQLKKEQAVLKEEIKKLKLEKASYLNLERIEKIATQKLNLVYPRSDQIIIWAEESLIQE
ncbi:MAG: cell division protein FtsL, partial [Candidatus Aminicenantia bacterium]